MRGTMAEKGRSESLELPLRSNIADDDSNSGGASATESDGSTKVNWSFSGQCVLKLFVDVIASVAFWYFMLFVYLPDWGFYALLGALVLTMILWRVYRIYLLPKRTVEAIPYTCGYVKQGVREMFLVATVHISPRAPLDVEEVIDKTRPDVAMIELDDERLDRMREPAPVEEAPPEPRPEHLQAISVQHQAGQASMTIFAQRATWNGEWADDVVSGGVIYDEDNAYGMLPSTSEKFENSFALVHRGSPNREFAPFALKAHHAHRSGAIGLLVINDRSKLPMHRLGGGDGSVMDELKIFRQTGNCGFPPIPVLLLSQEEGEKLRAACTASGEGASAPRVEFKVLTDDYPRRTLRKRLCQGAALLFSGIGILYGIIQCFRVEVGGEFLAAETAAQARGIPCTCIDVDLNRFWSKLGWAVVPTPRNLWNSLLSWLAFPRVCFQFLYPPQANIDVCGSMFLHAASFPIRTWVAFLLAGFCASKVTNFLLKLFGMAGEAAAEGSGVVEVETEEDRNLVTEYIMLLIEMYLLPQVYYAVAASRDEAMYRSVVAKGRDLNANRVVVVVGAGHANGILQRASTEGL